MTQYSAKKKADVIDLSLAKRHVRYIDLPAQYDSEKKEILECVDRVFSHGQFVDHPIVEQFEHGIAELTGTRHTIAVNSGTSALFLSLKALGITNGDEVVVPTNSYYSSASTVIQLGAKVIFADVLQDQNVDPASIESVITPNTKAIMPVHLTGRIADMDAIKDIADRKGLYIIEDAAQSIGSTFRGRPAGSFGDIAAFSGHPLKNLNAAGDAGYITTNNDKLADRIRLLRNHGLADRDTAIEWGYCARMDVLHAEILNMRLRHLDKTIDIRQHLAKLYREQLNPKYIFSAPCKSHEFNNFHLFVIQVECRDDLKTYLTERGIITAIHYRQPLHLQPAAAGCGYQKGSFPKAEHQANHILSLPIHQYLKEEDVLYVADCINNFYTNKP